MINEHNALVTRDWWLERWENQAVLEGYRRLAFVMLDAEIVAMSPSSVYRVHCDLKSMNHYNSNHFLKEKGVEQPVRPHEHWHVDIFHINIAVTYLHLCSLPDGCRRFLVHWGIRETMTRRKLIGSEMDQVLSRAVECDTSSPTILLRTQPRRSSVFFARVAPMRRKIVEWADDLSSVVAQPQEGRDGTEALSDRPGQTERLLSLRDHGRQVVRATQYDIYNHGQDRARWPSEIMVSGGLDNVSVRAAKP